MIIRQSAHDYNIAIFLNNKKGMLKTILLVNGDTVDITYPSSKQYFLCIDGIITKTSNSFKIIEEEYVKEVTKKLLMVMGVLIF